MSLYHDLMNAQDGGEAAGILRRSVMSDDGKAKGGGDDFDRPYLHFDLDARLMILFDKFIGTYCKRGSAEGGEAHPDCKCHPKSLIYGYCNPALCFGKWLCDEGTRAGLTGDEAEVVTKAATLLRSFRQKSESAPLQVQTKNDIIGAFFDGVVSTVPNKERVLAEMGFSKEAFAKSVLSAVSAETAQQQQKKEG